MYRSLQSSIQAQRIQAIGLTVVDIDRSISFYTKVLQFEIISDITGDESSHRSESVSHTCVRTATLKLGDETIRLMQYLDHHGKPMPQDSQSNDLWFQHLAIVVSDMDRAYAHLQSFPIEPISTAPQTIPPGNKAAAYIQAYKFRDPDRHPLELICFPSGKGQAKWHQDSSRLFLGIDHTAIAIANTEQSLQFYRDFLGMQVDGGSFNWRETQARMDGVPDAKVRITALKPAQGGLGIELLEYVHPTNGRPMPSDLHSDDLAYVQVELIVKENDRVSEQHELMRDPTGHFILVIPESAH